MLTRHFDTRTLSDGGSGRAIRVAEQADLDKRHAGGVRELLESMPNPAAQATLVSTNPEASKDIDDAT